MPYAMHKFLVTESFYIDQEKRHNPRQWYIKIVPYCNICLTMIDITWTNTLPQCCLTFGEVPALIVVISNYIKFWTRIFYRILNIFRFLNFYILTVKEACDSAAYEK